MTERKWKKKKSVEEGDIALLKHQTSKVVLKNTSFTPGIGMHHSLPIRLWKMLVSTKKNLELAKSYTRSTDFIFVNIDFRDRGSILYPDQQTRFWVDSRKIETPSHD